MHNCLSADGKMPQRQVGNFMPRSLLMLLLSLFFLILGLNILGVYGGRRGGCDSR